MKNLKLFGLLLVGFISFQSTAQEFDANLQLRPRLEYRNGYKSLMTDGQNPTSFISQRSRLNFSFSQDKLKTKISLQNVRTWGDTPTLNTSDVNGIALFEAWAQYDLCSKWSSRFGRQVLSYDNQRIMGEVDWNQQGRSHDAMLFSYHTTNQQLDLGFAVNADKDNLVKPSAPYTTNYKAMQYAWYHTKVYKVGMSLLFLNIGNEFLNTSSKPEVAYGQTYGTYLTYKEGNWDTNLGLYGQSGKNSSNNNVNAWYLGANAEYAFTDKFKSTLGFEYLSGKDTNDSSTNGKSFNPIFGTNHAFNGYMDYFYVGNHLNSVGLQDAYLKLNYNQNKWQFNLIPHYFASAAKVMNGNEKMDSYLGTELDFTVGYAIQKEVKLSGGYSQMFGSSTLEKLKAVANPASTSNWAWVMISINPQIFSSKK